MKIVFMGYMASGKSAIGKRLAHKMNKSFIDLDSFIEERELLSISEIFEQKGEIYFRKKETEYLNSLLDKEDDFVLSLGGGTPCYSDNLSIILKKSTSFYLKASVDTIYNRLKRETAQRPLVATIGMENLAEFIAKHLFERQVFYNKANQIIAVDNKCIDEIVKEIESLC